MVVHVLTKFSTCLYLLNLVPTCTCACTTVVSTAVLNLVPTCTAVVREKAKQTAMQFDADDADDDQF